LKQETVLIAALSGRGLAAAARRAGLRPLVVDAFGDADTRQLAGELHVLGNALTSGFRARTLVPALQSLAATAASEPVGLVLGSGFEDCPKLVATLARHFRLLGNGPEAIARSKDPACFFPLLDALGIAHPETRLDRPSDPRGWLSKRQGGSGGAHVVACERARTTRGRYFQRTAPGAPVSLLAVAAGDQLHIVGFTRQWATGVGPRPYRYGGAAGPVQLDADTQDRMTDAAALLARNLGLAGLVSFDFLLEDDGTALLLEVNPRPGATLDVLDDDAGGLLHAHIAACRNATVTLSHPTAYRAAGIFYADTGPLTVNAFPWPQWSADRPGPGTRIGRGRPVTTVLAAGATAREAKKNCLSRLEELAQMLYGRAPDREPNNAKTHRARPERLGAGGQAR
jgi:uncharacterized protein